MVKYIKEHSDYKELFQLEFLLHDLYNGFIAGGCFKNLFNNETPKDVDVFYRSKEDLDIAIDKIAKDTDKFKVVYRNKNVDCYKHLKSGINVELNKRNWGKPKEVISKFDFSITKFALYFHKESSTKKDINKDYKEPFADMPELPVLPESDESEFRVIYDSDFFKHLHLKRLVIDDDLLFPISTFERSYRYRGYGYSLCRESKIKLVMGIRGTDFVDFSKDFYAGID